MSDPRGTMNGVRVRFQVDDAELRWTEGDLDGKIVILQLATRHIRRRTIDSFIMNSSSH